jgi:putative oxidoreductase
MSWSAALERYGLLFVRVYLGGFNLVSGLNYYAHLMPQPIPADAAGRAFMESTLAMGLFQLAKAVELIGGACLLFNIAVPFALVLLFPVTVNVFVMNVFSSPLLHVKASGGRNFAFHLLLLAGYGRYYLPLIGPIATARPIWRKDPS